MNILAMEEDMGDRKRLEMLLKKALPDMNICVFGDTVQALEFAKKNPISAAFIDMGRSIQNPGYFLAKNILEIQKTNIIFTNYEWKHTREALELRASGYIRKPLRYEEILEELYNLRYPLTEAGQPATPSTYAKKRRHWLYGKTANT